MKRSPASAVPGAERRQAIAVVSPHAGYVYSGPVAGEVFSTTAMPPVFVVLGPAHREIGPLFAVQAKGSWETPPRRDTGRRGPGGPDPRRLPARRSRTNGPTRSSIPSRSSCRSSSTSDRTPAIVPVCVSAEAGFAELETLGRALAAAIKEDGRGTLIVASTDMSHYVDRKTAEAKDMQAIRKVLDLDPRGLFDTVVRERISMCGFQPTAAALVAAIALGATGAELVRYRTSGDATGDYDQVVGYAGLRIH
ncbi:MAG: AmmeMemoRadiSam system protein B [Candidatus Moduliflexus flocculans]|nr:AmmeMemoRadiSam system protein B [Candidatus Moduliflexus flocculans]